jgi:hypothetical protein
MWYWERGSSSRAPALQVQSPEFKLQYCKKKKKITKLECAWSLLEKTLWAFLYDMT